MDRPSTASLWLPIALASLAAIAPSASAQGAGAFGGETLGRVAVLPIEGALADRAKSTIRRHLGSFLQDRGYATLDADLLDSRLTREGLKPWEPRWLPADDRIAAIGLEIGVDAILVGHGFDESNLSAVFFFDRSFSGRIRILSAKTGRTLWSAEASEGHTGGLLLQSGQAIRAISDTLSKSNEIVLEQLAVGLAMELVSDLPRNAKPVALGPRPVVERVSVAPELRSSAAAQTLGAGDVLIVEAHGTAGGRGRAAVPGVAGSLPLVEQAPGVYRGSMRIEAGSGVREGKVSVAIYDAYGRASRPAASDSVLRVAAPRSPRIDEGHAVAIAGRRPRS